MELPCFCEIVPSVYNPSPSPSPSPSLFCELFCTFFPPSWLNFEYSPVARNSLKPTFTLII